MLILLFSVSTLITVYTFWENVPLFSFFIIIILPCPSCVLCVISLQSVQFIGMLLHRLMTLGHIVASTKLGLFGARKHLNPEEFLNRHGVEVPAATFLIFSLFLLCAGDEGDPGHCRAAQRRSYNGGKKQNKKNWDCEIDLKEAVEQELKNITEGGDDVKRRLSRTATIKNLHRSDTISALKRKQVY